MKVLMVTSTFLPKIGGIEFYIKELCNFLKKNGIISDVAVINKNINIYENKKIENINVFYIPIKGGIHPFYFFDDLNKFFNVSDYDVINIHDPHIGGISLHFKLYKYNKPLILTSHGGIFHTKKNLFFKNIYWNFFAKIIIKNYRKVIAISKNDYSNFKKITDNIVHIPNGINFKKFNKIFHNFSIDKKFIYFGRFSSNKGIEDLLKVFEKLISNDKQYKLTLVGKSDSKNIENIINFYAKKYNKNIFVKEFLSDEELLQELSYNTFFITATRFEGFGLSIFEALASGRVGILNNIKPLNEFFSEKEVLFCDFSNTDECVIKIKQLCENHLKIQRLRENSIKVVEQFSWENIGPKIIKIYKEIINVK